ncbi:MAG: cyclic nucleotide-binding domain-containing protein [Thermodesulfobacteriota bacterium]
MKGISSPAPHFLQKALKTSPFFRNWPAQAFREVTPLFKLVTYKKGEELLKQNKRARFLFVLLKGVLVLSVPKGNSDLVIEVLKKRGDLCGWSAIVPPRKYTASAIAMEEVKVLQIKGKDLEIFLRSRPQLGWSFWQKLASLIASRLGHTRSLLVETLA